MLRVYLLLTLLFVSTFSAAAQCNGTFFKESTRQSLSNPFAYWYFEDFDNDGRTDVIVLNSRTKPTAIRNETPGDAHWVELNLVGINCNRDAVGSQVLMTTQAGTQLLEVHSGRGYQSHFGSRLHFGLGTAQTVKRLEVRWHGQAVQVIEGLPANKAYLIREGDQPIELKATP